MWKMAFRFGRGKEISRWLRVRPRVFLIGKNRRGANSRVVQPTQTTGGHPHAARSSNAKEYIAGDEINAFEWEGDFKPMARQALKELLENRLDQEMAEYLGVSRYEHASDRHDYRNGHYLRHLLTGDGRYRAFSAAQPKGEVSLQAL